MSLIKLDNMKKKIGYIIFVRFRSKRLPGKAMIEINNFPTLYYVIERAKKIRPRNKIIVATTNLKSDEKIIDFCKKNKILYFRGPNKDVYLRAALCCKKFKLNSFLRICADRIFFDFNLASKMVKIFKKNKFDIVTNSLVKSYPRGTSIEIISYKKLKETYKLLKDKNDKEHIFNYFYKNKKNFRIKNILSNYSNKITKINLSLDTKSDFIKIEKCLKSMIYSPIVETKKIISYYSKK